MHIAHHPMFVLLSSMTACLGSWTALDLFRRVRAHRGAWRGGWLFAAAVAMGLSIWSMHFIAMLGFDPGAEVRYDVGLTVLSLLLAIAATAFAFFFASREGTTRLVVSGVVMGAGICLMHYTGMAAVMTQATLRNDPLFVFAAFVVAVTASSGALVAAKQEHTLSQRALAAVVLGSAVVGMHYTAMFGVRLIDGAATNRIAGGMDAMTLAIAIAGGTFFILFLALIAALSDRRFEALAAREALRSEQLLRAVIEHLPMGVFVAAAPSGDIRFANAEAARLLGHTVGPEPVWSRSADVGAVREDGSHLPERDHALYQAMQENRRIGPRLQAYRRGDGRVVQLEVTAAPVPDRKGNSTLAVVAFQDVTEKLRAEKEARRQAELQRVNELLEERVASALAEKAEVQAALNHAQRLESLGRLTGGVAHDFNNLLTVVIGALDVILRQPAQSERAVRLGDAALAAARRGERLTAQLLTFARRQPLRPEACDLNDLLRVGEPLFRGAAGQQRLVKLVLCSEPAVALIDPAQFEGALLNLIVNAADASAENGEIAIETAIVTGAPTLGGGRFFRLRVTDTGTGMSEEVMKQIFDPFFTTKGPGKGTGLGLSQVYGFVKQSGGEITVDSEEGAGASFSVYLPLTDQGAQEKPSQTPTAWTHIKPMNVLLVEDDAAVATITEAMLHNLGHQVFRAENAARALEILDVEKSVDLLLSDIVMPGSLNGLELAQRAVQLRPELQVLLSSGYTGAEVEEALAGGAWPFLKKPYVEYELAEHLVRVARNKRDAVVDQ
ncbi:PAS domain S-box-containing protein [Povalibacter uvarum]|uniref:histidine kinase n=1 Tax=Povalibacter uvarum TaxID=732238 RepID=A0A841HED2_9GAMM|nr:MHYT domain-containing protein [Povalibacter uvarum]MBB6091207.1 PAS domain S-box-containing protein [Povalibacter uvarum]